MAGGCAVWARVRVGVRVGVGVVDIVGIVGCRCCISLVLDLLFGSIVFSVVLSWFIIIMVSLR